MIIDDFFNAKPVVQEQQQELTEFKPNPKKGQNGVFKAVVRFLPNPNDAANKSIIGKNVVFLKNIANNKSMTVDSPSSVGQQDILQNTYFSFRNSSNPILQENAQYFSRKLQYASLVQVISCESVPSLVNKILVWKYGTKIYEKLNGEMNPPMGEPRNPFNLFTGRPFAVQVKEVGGFPNYDNCGFFDLDVSQSGMRIVNTNAQGQPQIYVVTTDTIATPQGKEMVFNYLKENTPDMTKYEYHDWTAETTQFVNECIQLYSSPQATMAAKAAAQNPGLAQVQQQPTYNQAVAQPQLQMQAPAQPSMPKTGNTQPFTGPAVATAPQMPVEIPTMGLGTQSVSQVSPQGFSAAPTLGADVADLLNNAGAPTPTTEQTPQTPLDLTDVLNGQFIQ